MDNIIYISPVTVPWDTQSAFKMTSYSVVMEKDMIYCYLKGYVRGSDLILNSYQFIAAPEGKKALTLTVGIEGCPDFVSVTYGYDGIDSVSFRGDKPRLLPELSSYRADDEQGFYWCGEMTFGREMIGELFGASLAEGSRLRINLEQHLESGKAVLFPGTGDPAADAGHFTVMRY